MGFDPLPPGYWSCSGDSAMHFRNKLQIIPNLVGVMSNFRTPNLDPERGPCVILEKLLIGQVWSDQRPFNRIMVLLNEF